MCIKQVNARVLFLDRDGTVIVNQHYLHDPAKIVFIDGALEVLKELQDKYGYTLIIVTNQSGIGRGMFTVDEMHAVNNEMLRQMNERGVEVSKVYFCPHAPDENCLCRKPGTKMLEDAQKDFKIAHLSDTIMFGDSEVDTKLGLAVNAHTFCLNVKHQGESVVAENGVVTVKDWYQFYDRVKKLNE